MASPITVIEPSVAFGYPPRSSEFDQAFSKLRAGSNVNSLNGVCRSKWVIKKAVKVDDSSRWIDPKSKDHYRCYDYVYGIGKHTPWHSNIMDNFNYLEGHREIKDSSSWMPGDILLYFNYYSGDWYQTHDAVYAGYGLARSKFSGGDVFLHPVNSVPESYGKKIRCFRKVRESGAPTLAKEGPFFHPPAAFAKLRDHMARHIMYGRGDYVLLSMSQAASTTIISAVMTWMDVATEINPAYRNRIFAIALVQGDAAIRYHHRNCFKLNAGDLNENRIQGYLSGCASSDSASSVNFPIEIMDRIAMGVVDPDSTLFTILPEILCKDKFDAILFHGMHTHLRDPVGVGLKASSMLKPDGMLSRI